MVPPHRRCLLLEASGRLTVMLPGGLLLSTRRFGRVVSPLLPIGGACMAALIDFPRRWGAKSVGLSRIATEPRVVEIRVTSGNPPRECATRRRPTGILDTAALRSAPPQCAWAGGTGMVQDDCRAQPIV